MAYYYIQYSLNMPPQIELDKSKATEEYYGEDLTERLTLGYLAKHDLNTALGQAEDLYRAQDFKTIYPLLRVARALPQVDIDPEPLIGKLSQVAELNANSWQKRVIYRTIANIHLSMGNLSAAEILIEAAIIKGEHPDPYFHLDIARVRVRLGENPEPYLTAAKKLAGKYLTTENEENLPEIEYSSYFRFKDLILIAQEEKAMGLDAEETLLAAVQVFDSFASDLDPNDYYNTFSALAETYSLFGDFNTALEYVDRLPLDTPRDETKKRQTLQNISKEQFVQGDLGGAVETAQKTGNNYFMAEIFAQVALQEIHSGADPTESIARAKEYAEICERRFGKGVYGDNGRLATVYALIGQAKVLVGQDSKFYFTQAFDKLPVPPQEVDYDEIKFRHILSIARAQAEVGIDCLPTLRTALEWADNIAPEDSEDHFLLGQQYTCYDRIIETQISCGQYDFARETINHKYWLSEDVIKMLVKLAMAEAEEGLPDKDVETLPADVIEEARLLAKKRVQR